MRSNASLAPFLNRFSTLRVTVIGDAVLDSYLEGEAGRICREAPVPNVTVSSRVDAPGGASNTAANVHSLGGKVSFLSVCGDDAEGTLLRQTLEACGAPASDLLTEPGRQTVAKHRLSAADQLLLRFEKGDHRPLSADIEEKVIARLTELFPQSDAVIVSDYGGGTLTPRVIEALASLQSLRPTTLIVDSRCRLPTFARASVTAVKPNYEELLELIGADADEVDDRVELVARHAEEILARSGARIAAVTLDSDGAVVLEHGQPPYRTWAAPSRKSCVAGAGDTFVAAMTLALAAGTPTALMAELASAAAAVVVGKQGTARCSGRELREYLAGPAKFVHDVERLAERADFLHRQGQRIVFTNGCFDLLHAGHIAFLNAAKALGNLLIVGVNSDASVRRLKGPDRPINPLEDRLQVLASLGCVDHVIDFDSDTCCDLVRQIRPDVFVKGGDYLRAELPEAALVESLGGIVRILPYERDCSTTGLIERIRRTPVLSAR